jgi:hypothetical protein
MLGIENEDSLWKATLLVYQYNGTNKMDYLNSVYYY